MAKRKSSTEIESADATAMENPPAPSEAATVQETTATEAAPGTETQPQAAVQAPEKGKGRTYTIDNRLGYRKEDSPDGKRRQIRFAERPDGERPDDEILAPVREQKPDVSWTSKDKAWQARVNAEGLEAIDSTDQKLAEVGRKRTGSPER
jgi:hypothetical protein